MRSFTRLARHRGTIPGNLPMEDKFHDDLIRSSVCERGNRQRYRSSKQNVLFLSESHGRPVVSNKLHEATKQLPKQLGGNGWNNNCSSSPARQQFQMDHTRTMKEQQRLSWNVLEGTDRTLLVAAVSEVPGRPKDQNAYRSDLTRLYGITAMTTTICTIHNSQHCALHRRRSSC